jgi:ribose 5-phosphate isomerase B
LKIALGSDHIGYQLKNTVKSYLENKGLSFTDFGTFKINEGDYPEFAFKVANALFKDDFDRGLLIGSSGIGMCITANKVRNIRAVVAPDIKTAQRSRQLNDTNILCLASDDLPEGKALDLIEVWLNTSFEGGKHQDRVNLITKLTGL